MRCRWELMDGRREEAGTADGFKRWDLEKKIKTGRKRLFFWAVEIEWGLRTPAGGA